jgi:ectoine hydroxylase-related dioxygenase (phytanoyl-CoA dioxygenase family)
MALGNVFRAGVAPAAVVEAILADGYAIVRGALPPERLARLRAEVEPVLAATPCGADPFLGLRSKRIGNVFMRFPATREMAIDPLVLAVADGVLGPWCATYRINFTGIQHLEPGEEVQGLHRDGHLYPFVDPGPPTILGTIWAITDYTAANGATLVVPGSHLWPEEREPLPSEVAPAEMPAGSLLLYTSGTIHGAGANASDTVRTGCAIHYNLGWLRQEENQYLSIPPAAARELPERLQRLVGYDFGGPYLGIALGDDPIKLLQDEPQGPNLRSRPEISAAHRRMKRLKVVGEAPLRHEVGLAAGMPGEDKAKG